MKTFDEFMKELCENATKFHKKSFKLLEEISSNAFYQNAILTMFLHNYFRECVVTNICQDETSSYNHKKMAIFFEALVENITEKKMKEAFYDINKKEVENEKSSNDTKN